MFIRIFLGVVTIKQLLYIYIYMYIMLVIFVNFLYHSVFWIHTVNAY